MRCAYPHTDVLDYFLLPYRTSFPLCWTMGIRISIYCISTKAQKNAQGKWRYSDSDRSWVFNVEISSPFPLPTAMLSRECNLHRLMFKATHELLTKIRAASPTTRLLKLLDFLWIAQNPSLFNFISPLHSRSNHYGQVLQIAPLQAPLSVPLQREEMERK